MTDADEERDGSRAQAVRGPLRFCLGRAAHRHLPPEGLPEIAFVGRSNAGKSSLVNALTGRKTLARVSQTRAPHGRSISSTWAAG